MNKIEADDLMKLSTSFLKKHDYFSGYRSGSITWTRGYEWNESKDSISIAVSTQNEDNMYAELDYKTTYYYSGDEKKFKYKVPITTTPCKFGGKRYWFICPIHKNGKRCGRRVGTLYKGGDYFACRHCYELTYASRKVNRKYAFYPIFRILDLERKAQELYDKISTPYYRGKPTRKQRKLQRIWDEIDRFGKYL